MLDNLLTPGYDLTTPDGYVVDTKEITPGLRHIIVRIDHIPKRFVGFQIDLSQIHFNLKSTLAQLGLHTRLISLELSKEEGRAIVYLEMLSLDPISEVLLNLIEPKAYIGKLFAADERRRVRDPEYLSRMFGRSDRIGNPLLSLGGLPGTDDLILEKIEGRTVAFLSLKKGIYTYDKDIHGLLPTAAKALQHNHLSLRELLRIHQALHEEGQRFVSPNHLLLVRTLPLHVRTVFGRVVPELLPKGFYHTSADILEPETEASGDIYELFGESKQEITDIPIEFYTLEPYREHIFFQDRDQLKSCLEDPETLFNAFETAPEPADHKTAVFVVKGTQLLSLKPEDWICEESPSTDFPGIFHSERQSAMVDRYVENQPCYPFLKAMRSGAITSQGVFLTRYFPTPIMKKALLGETIQRFLKGIYFEYPSRSHGDFFSHEDRSFLHDLAKFGIPVYWVNSKHHHILQYVPKAGKDAGMFVPLHAVEAFSKATMVGIYGSNLIEGDLEQELTKLLQGLLDLKATINHPLLNKDTPLAVLTGGGPGVMSIGNKAAKNVGILSCANVVDFGAKPGTYVNEQLQNPYVEAKMTYQLERLVERQAEFHLDLPIFLLGGIGTDFEFSLEELRKKVGISAPTPIILFGDPEYWKQKITSRFHCNLNSGTIKGSEWISNCFYCVQTAQQALSIYRDFFTGVLVIDRNSLTHPDGFKTVV